MQRVAVTVICLLVCVGMEVSGRALSFSHPLVESGSVPSNIARIEKSYRYIESHFKHSYRTEQLIITTTKKGVIRKENLYPTTGYLNYTFVFERTFLEKVLKLQTAVEKLEVPYGNGTTSLSDICSKPMSPSNKNCAIKSILQYFQNNVTLLNETKDYGPYQFWTADYLDHIHYCVRNPDSAADKTPLGLPCLAKYGVPLDPDMVLRGYNGTAFHNASALIMTFVLNKNFDPQETAWEKAFLNLVTTYNNTDNMVISYNPQLTEPMPIRRPEDLRVALLEK